MKKSNILLGTAFFAVIGFITVAADHMDAPAAQGSFADITAFYAAKQKIQISWFFWICKVYETRVQQAPHFLMKMYW